MRKLFVGGNWKMQADKEKVTSLVKMLNNECSNFPSDVDIVICPSFVFLSNVVETITPKVHVAAQNCHEKSLGAFTGEISVNMLKDVGCSWVLIGHSERRNIYNENNELLVNKTRIALENSLNIIYCIGELLCEREANKTESVIREQMKHLINLQPSWSNIVIAYEPVWAIGTGVTASPEQAEEVHALLRSILCADVSREVADQVRIIYGGSVTAENCKLLAQKENVDGFLVGGASLKSDFLQIIKARC